MIDLRILREDPDRLRASQRARGEDDSIVDTLLDLDARRRSALSSFESLRAEQKSVGKSVSKASGEEREALLARAKELAAQVKAAEAEAAELAAKFDELLMTVPNIVEEGAPVGGEEDESPASEWVGDEDENYELIDDKLALEGVLPQLDDRERLILRLRFVEDMTQSQIAEEIGVSQMHVSRLLNRTLEQLRTSLSEIG